jgi:hypothetical protein
MLLFMMIVSISKMIEVGKLSGSNSACVMMRFLRPGLFQC